MVGKVRYYKSFREVWQETLQERKARGLTAVCSDLQPFLNKTTWPQSGERLPESLIEAVRCREILDVGVWAQTQNRLLLVVALLSIFAIFISSDIMPAIKSSLGGYLVPLGVVAVILASIAMMVVVCHRMICGIHNSRSEHGPASNGRLANHIAALHLLYVSQSAAQSAQSEAEAQPFSLSLVHPVGTGQVRERCIHTVTACGSRYLVMQNGRVFVDR